MGEKDSIEENIFIILEIVLIEEKAHIYPDVLCSIGRFQQPKCKDKMTGFSATQNTDNLPLEPTYS